MGVMKPVKGALKWLEMAEYDLKVARDLPLIRVTGSIPYSYATWPLRRHSRDFIGRGPATFHRRLTISYSWLLVEN